MTQMQIHQATDDTDYADLDCSTDSRFKEALTNSSEPTTATSVCRCFCSAPSGPLWSVNGEGFEAGAGDIPVIKAGEVHSFKCIGDAPLVHLDVYLSPRVI